ncbi:TraB/GumN family protein [Hyphomicrobium methylovorum]|uniref:TraB/GumN family protein n=1 Tax=Hyphomicrobium methylovorum TaxID=84 RepID=UPI0015E64AD8|nr:TraB/GumN family protein [Hyphomicrobium methylovorum]
MTHGVSAQSSSQDKAPPCNATSVLEELDLKNRPRLEQILAEAARVANAQAVLWKIEKDNLAPSYLFGTVHVIDESMQTLSPAVRRAIASSKVIAVEAAQPASKEAWQASMADANPLMVSLDRELERVLDEHEMSVVERALIAAGYPGRMAFALKPWAATMFLADSPCQHSLQERGLMPIDAIIVERAENNNLPIVGLETTLEQYQSLASIPSALQVAWLKASIELHPRVDDISETMAQLYRFRRLDAVWSLTQIMAPQAGLTDDMLQSLRSELVGKRNARMLERALPLLDKGGAFIAVGAMHQIGPEGLVALLKQKGFSTVAIE